MGHIYSYFTNNDLNGRDQNLNDCNHNCNHNCNSDCNCDCNYDCNHNCNGYYQKLTRNNQDWLEYSQHSIERNQKLNYSNEVLTKYNQELTNNNKDWMKYSQNLVKRNQELTKRNQELTKSNKNLVKRNQDWIKYDEDLNKTHIKRKKFNLLSTNNKRKTLNRGSGRKGEINQIHFDQYERIPTIDGRFMNKKSIKIFEEEEEEYEQEKYNEKYNFLNSGYQTDDSFISDTDEYTGGFIN